MHFDSKVSAKSHTKNEVNKAHTPSHAHISHLPLTHTHIHTQISHIHSHVSHTHTHTGLRCALKGPHWLRQPPASSPSS